MRIDHLTITRFTAALLLVLFHTVATSLSSASLVGKLLLAGDSGVSFFFVLSGFILVVSNVNGQHLPNRIRKGRFWRNRFARIYPLYALALALTFLASILTNNALLNDLSTGSVAGSALLIQAWIPAFAMDLNYPGWSLSAEVFFYALFPFLYTIMVRRPTQKLVVIAGLVWTISLAVHAYMVGQMEADRTVSFHNLTMYFPLLQVNTFLVGMVAGFSFIRHREWLEEHRNLLAVLLLLMLVVISWTVISQLPVLRLRHNGLFSPLFVLLILWLSVQSNALSRWLSRPLPVYLGEISYGIYLLQVPVGMLMFYVNYQWLHWPTWLYLPAYLIVLGLFAGVCYQWIESPARRRIRHWRLPQLTGPSASDEHVSRPV